MKSETQLKSISWRSEVCASIKKSKKMNTRPLEICLLVASLLTVLNACSFVELHPGAQNIIFAKDDSCQLVGSFEAKVNTENAYISRTEQAIAEELQILAQNEAFKKKANAIWPESDIDQGRQHFSLLRCAR